MVGGTLEYLSLITGYRFLMIVTDALYGLALMTGLRRKTVISVRSDGARGATVMLHGGGGVVVNISSVHEYIPWRKFSHYCASKSGLKLLMESAASELAGRRIRIVNIAPGAIDTPMNQVLQDDPEARRAAERQIPIGRIGRADEVAAVVAWVASEEASYITGTTIVVDGGLSLRAELA